MIKLAFFAIIVTLASICQGSQIAWISEVEPEGTATKLVNESNTAIDAIAGGGSIVLIRLVATDLAAFNAGTWSASAGSVTELQTAEISTGKAAGKVSMVYTFAYSESKISDGDYVAAVLKNGDGTYDQFTYYGSNKSVTDTLLISGLKSKGSLFEDEFAFATEGNFMAVPEPTSGMLLLLGMAGLALKRKRA